MTYTKLNNLLNNNTEIHYVEDSIQFFLDNNLNIEDYKQHKFILFQYTTNMPETIDLLQSNSIDYKIETDDWDLDFILI